MKERRRFCQSVSEMEHIPIAELGSRLDELLERCNKENVGFVIDDEHKSYVLCPARWITPCFDEEFGCIVNSALRYAIDRHTYLPSVIVNFVRRHIDALDIKTLSTIIEDIEKELRMNSNIYEPDMWRSLQQDCEVALEHRIHNHLETSNDQ